LIAYELIWQMSSPMQPCGVDLEDALRANVTKATDRFSVAYGQADIDRYVARRAENLARILEDEEGGRT
jgi:hypothetical protein